MDRAAKIKLINTATGDPKMRRDLTAMIDEPAPMPKLDIKKKPAKKAAKKKAGSKK